MVRGLIRWGSGTGGWRDGVLEGGLGFEFDQR